MKLDNYEHTFFYSINENRLSKIKIWYIPLGLVCFEAAGFFEFEDALAWFLKFVEAFFFALTSKIVSFATVLMLE